MGDSADYGPWLKLTAATGRRTAHGWALTHCTPAVRARRPARPPSRPADWPANPQPLLSLNGQPTIVRRSKGPRRTTVLGSSSAASSASRRRHLVRPGVRRLVRACRHSSCKRCSVWRWSSSCHLPRFTAKRMTNSVLRSISPLPAVHWHTTSFRRYIAKSQK